MNEPLEIELKLELAPEDAARIAAAPALAGLKADTAELVSVYFDTPDEALRRKGYVLRVRHKGDRRIQTVKAEGAAAAGLFVRPEWECDIEGDTPRLDASSGPLAELFLPETLAALVPRFETRVTRTLYLLAVEGAEIELAVDIGKVVAGRRRADLCEIELELKSGPPRALFDLARAFDDHVPLRLGVRAKAERGFALAAGGKFKASKAEPLHLDITGDARETFAAIAQSCLRQFRLNEALVMTSGAEAPLHQARVGLRRLRSAFSLCKPLFAGDDRANLLRLELKWLAAELGEVRNLDVLIPRMAEPVRGRLVETRAHAMEHVQATLASARTRLLMIDLAEWLMLGTWRVTPADPALAERPAPDFAADILDKQRRRIKKGGRHLAAADDEHRHRVRIEGKKLRYAAEFFGALYPRRKAQRRREAFLSAIEGLQDLLGELNDLVTGPEVLAALGVEETLPVPSKAERRRMLESAEDALDTLLDVKRFWR